MSRDLRLISKQRRGKLRDAGLCDAEILRVMKLMEKCHEESANEVIDKSFLYMLAIPLNVLVTDYWPKTAKKRAPKFIEDVLNLYEAVQAGVVSDESLAKLLEDMAGVKIEKDMLSSRREKED